MIYVLPVMVSVLIISFVVKMGYDLFSRPSKEEMQAEVRRNMELCDMI